MKELDFSKQIEILNFCISEGIPLHHHLESLGLNYDDLQYRINPKQLLEGFPEFKGLNHQTNDNNGIPFVSFFTGSGGLDLGFEAAGFRSLGAIEVEEIFCNTLRRNHPDWTVLGPPDYKGDVRDRNEITSRLSQIGVEDQFEGIFIGGPPCQPFSIASNQRYSKSGGKYKRIGFTDNDFGNLLFEFIWYIKTYKPKAFLIENVPGLLTIDKGEQVSIAIKELRALGYKVAEPMLINSSDYGVPQNRRRIFIIGGRTRNEYVLPQTNNGKVPVIKALEESTSDLPNHITRNHQAKTILRYIELDFGKRDHLGRVDRLDPFAPAKTVIGGGTKGGGRSHLHPYIPRTLTVRECARIQTFPDDYVFCGPPARQYTQVGNAVPPLLSMKLAIALINWIAT